MEQTLIEYKDWLLTAAIPFILLIYIAYWCFISPSEKVPVDKSKDYPYEGWEGNDSGVHDN